MDGMKRKKQIVKSLKDNRRDWEGHYEQLEQNFLPRRGQFSEDPASKAKSDRGKNLNGRMLDSTPVRALRILQSGLQAGISSPSRPWFRVVPVDTDLRKSAAVKEYMGRAEHEMRRLLERSGVYNMLHTGYGDLGVYGSEAAIIEDRSDSQFRAIQLVPGSYWLGMSDDYQIDTLAREYNLTVNQIVGRFVFKGVKYGEPDWDVVPHRIKKMYDDGDIAKHEKISQLITPRVERDPRKQDGKNKPIQSCYWLTNDDRADSQRLLGDYGYDKNPISASRWNVAGYEVYGTSPAMEALPDVKELMTKRRDYLEMLKRANRPTVNAHTDLRNSKFSLLPGSVNFMDDPSKGIVPTFQSSPQFGPLADDIQASRDSVWSAMYADLFMMISQLDRRQITATEIDERREEKLIALGPVLERQHYEKHKPLVERTFMKVLESGVLGEPPEELEGQDVEIDFISMLAQAQKAVATGAMERFSGFLGNISAVKPDVLDKFDEDAAVDEYGGMLGVPSRIIKTNEEVEALRQARAQKQEMMEGLAAAEQATKAASQGAQAAQVLSQADSPRSGNPADILAQAGLA